MMPACFVLIPATLLAIAVGPALAGDMAELEYVTVVGKRPQLLQEAAATASVITADDIEIAVAFDLRDVLRHEPGVSLARDPHRFGAGSPTVRGLGGNRVLAETDGVPAARAFAVGSFSNTGRQFADLAVIERIELLRGPASALYGSDAIAGVVAITTVDPSDLLRGDAGHAIRARAGHATDDGSSFAGITGAARAGPFEALLAYAHRTGDELGHAGGSPPANPRDAASDALLARAIYGGFGQPLRLSAAWNRQQDRTEVDSLELSGGRFANTIFMRGDDRGESLQLVLDQPFGLRSGIEGQWRAYWNETQIRQLTHEERRAAPPATPPLAIEREFHYRERVSGLETTLAREYATATGTHRLVGGIEFTEKRVVERRDGLQTNLATGATTATILGEALPVRDFPISRIEETGLYLQDEWRPGDGRWSLIPALRADWYRLRPVVDTMYVADNPNAPPVAIDHASVSPKFGVGWRPTDQVAIYLQYAHGFRSPPFDDVNIGLDLPQFNTRAIPNPDLEPERSDSLELGLRLSSAAVTGAVSLYGSRYRDFIESRVNIGAEPGTGTTLFQSRNVAEARIYGAEAALDLALRAWHPSLADWGARVAFGWTEGEDTVRDRPLNSIDPPRGFVGLRYDAPSGSFGIALDLTLVAAKHGVDESAAPQYRPGGYTIADLRFHWRVNEHIAVDAGLFNLGDRAYHEWATVRGRAPGDPLLPLYLEPGRNLAITVSATLD
ncbi:MAG: TonB-dependent hemoglobin/transferrin/lactoferrin family receptor [Steroidobacteraceae bacterium]